jgi:hypothetical protein
MNLPPNSRSTSVLTAFSAMPERVILDHEMRHPSSLVAYSLIRPNSIAPLHQNWRV